MPSKPKESSFLLNIDSTNTTINFTAAGQTFEAESGPLDFFRFDVFNEDGNQSFLFANGTFLVHLLPGSNYVEMSTVVNTVEGCGDMVSAETLSFTICSRNYNSILVFF